MKIFKKIVCIGAMALLGLSNTHAQSIEVYGNPDFWNQFNIDYKINDKWKIGSELHYRLNDWFKSSEQFIFRPFVDYKLNPSVEFSGGYTYTMNYPYDKYPALANRPEHNLWEQVTLHQKINRTQVSHRFRAEQRYLSNYVDSATGFSFEEGHWVNRLRYRFTISFPLYQKLQGVLFDEVFINAGSHFRLVAFDRNWIHLGVKYPIVSKLDLQLAYLHQYIRRSVAIYERHHGIQVFLAWHL